MGIENQNNQPEIREGIDNSSKDHEDSARDNLLAEAQASAVSDRSKDKTESSASKSGDAGSKEGITNLSVTRDLQKHAEFVDKISSPEYKQELKNMSPEQLTKAIEKSNSDITAQEAKIAALIGASVAASAKAEQAAFKK